jgi:hypothetical protein
VIVVALSWADRAASRILGILSPALGAVCALFLLTWVPHYLTWPIWADTDQFMVSARSWDAGVRPYRDLPDFDFPAPIYLAYVLGKVFGWGRSAPFYAADVMLLLMLGGALLGWSRRLFGTWLPGLIGFLHWLGYYLGLDYSLVGQRDWQATALVVLSLLGLESLPQRLGLPLSALGMAAALTCRPQAMLFVPAFLSAVVESSRRPGAPAHQPLRALAGWSAALAVALLAGFGPLIAAGVLDDFIRVLQVVRVGGPYNTMSCSTFSYEFKDLFLNDWPTKWWTAALVLVAVAGPEALRRPARTWTLALIGSFFYAPLSPCAHRYLLQPTLLLQSVALAPLAALVLAAPRITPSFRLAGLSLLMYTAAIGWPRFCTFRDSFDALGPLARGEIPERAPPGCRVNFPSSGTHSDSWDDYRRLLEFLRHDVGHSRPVANLLRSLPFPAVNGPSDHLTPFPAAGGCLYLRMVDLDLEVRFAQALERTPGTLVVWRPNDPDTIPELKLPRVEAVIHRCFRPYHRIGEIEVWVRLDDREASPFSNPKGSANGLRATDPL